MNQPSNRTEGGGLTALSLAVLVIVVWIFPIPLVIYCAYLMLFSAVAQRAHRLLQPLISTWLRVALTGAVSLGLLAGILLLGPHSVPSILANELHPVTFSFYTMGLAYIFLLRLFVDALRDLWRSKERSKIS